MLTAIALLACVRTPPTPAEPSPSTPAVQETVDTMAPPPTRRSDVVDDYHGTQVADPYRWLEDPDDDEVKAWVQAQVAHTDAWLADVPQRDAIRARLAELWSYERRSVPQRAGDHWWFTHNDGLQPQPVIYRATSLDTEPEVVLDPNELSDDGTVAVMNWVPSPDGSKLAYTISDGGSDWRLIKVRDLATGTDLPDVIDLVKFSDLAWMPGGNALVYSRFDTKQGPKANTEQKLMVHRLGTDVSEDAVLAARPDQPEWGFSGKPTWDGDYLVIEVWEGTDENNRIFYKQLRHRGRPPRDLEERRTAPRVVDAELHELLNEADASYRYVTNEGRVFTFLTTHDAPRGRVVAIDLDQPEPEHWKEVLAQTDDTLQSVHRVGDQLFAVYLRDAQSLVRKLPLGGGAPMVLALPGVGTVEGFDGSPTSDETYLGFASYTQPGSLYHLPLSAAEPELAWAPELPFDPSEYRTEQIFVPSEDGTEVPVFLSYRGELERTGDRPTLLYGYGGFNIPLTPRFSSANLQWMEMGGVLAVANLRGGGEYGEAWHDAGRLKNKQNVFDDFIAVGEHLIADGITTTPKLATYGRSNGGLLVGATLVQRPDLWGAAMPAVGVLDMLRFHQWTIGWAWISDYGSSEDPEMFPILHGYSPLHNAVPADYPPTMVMTADHDDRVVPAHSFKFGAALQHAQQGDDPVLLRIETRAGHGAGKSTDMQIDEAADQWSFLVRALDLDAELPSAE
jgi:prolyl oligopeptidase